MARRNIEWIGATLEAKCYLSAPETEVSRILLDSRQFSSASGVIFFALRGSNHDGHDHLAELLAKGVRHFVVEELPEPMPEQANFLLVYNALLALQKLARAIRLQSEARVIAITGSNGKTVVKEWLSQLLQPHFKLCRSPKSYNSQVGVPLSLWELSADDELGIFEAGISKPGEMARLAEIIQPELGIFTNIGSAHSEYFDTLQEKIQEKLLLFRGVKRLVYEKNEGYLSKEIEAFAAEHHVELLSWSASDSTADLFLLSNRHFGEQQQWRLSYEGDDFELSLPFGDEASLQNALHALRLALALGVTPAQLAPRLLELQPVEMRLQMKTGILGNVIINDSYNSDLESLRIALHYQQNHGRQRPKILLLSDMLQTGLEPKELSQRMAEIINRFELDQVVAIGSQLKNDQLPLQAAVDYYDTTEGFLEQIYRYHWRDSVILLKGARAFRFEKISQRLEQKSHETHLNIYLNRLTANLNFFKGRLTPATGIMAMVKAFSYGSGAFEIANLLQFHGVSYLGVAYADEGVELRKAGIHLPILVLNPERNALQDLIEYQLEPEIYSFERLEDFASVVAASGLEGAFPIHLKLETGMHRLGFEAHELPDLIQQLRNTPQLQVASAFSHLAASDEGEHDDFTREQIADFSKMCARLKEGLGHEFMRHICNSSGILNFPEAHFEMVRLGISLYGVTANEEVKKYLKVVSELKASVSQIKQIEAGESVGYGRSYRADSPRRIAVVSIGYADGFRRSLSNGGGEVVIAGQRYPVVGRVCMDMVMVDVSGSTVQAGDEVEIFGQQLSVYELAERMGTIPYEVFTGIGRRVKRIYFME